MKNQKMGCAGLFAILVVIAILIQFWYIVLAIVALGIALYLYYHRKQQEAAAQAAKTAQEQADEQATIAKLKAYKDLLDTGAITQDEYNKKKPSYYGSTRMTNLNFKLQRLSGRQLVRSSKEHPWRRRKYFR